MNRAEIRKQVRREIHRVRLGTDQPVACAVCGEVEPPELRGTSHRRASRRLVEFHHLAGEANDPELGVFLCLTHHTMCSELMRQGIPLDRAPGRTVFERVEAVLRGKAIADRISAPVLEALADEFADEVRSRASRGDVSPEPGGES